MYVLCKLCPFCPNDEFRILVILKYERRTTENNKKEITP